jgi:hypothetical protein
MFYCSTQPKNTAPIRSLSVEKPNPLSNSPSRRSTKMLPFPSDKVALPYFDPDFFRQMIGLHRVGRQDKSLDV